jgi:HD-like signal output (HDOD) protein
MLAADTKKDAVTNAGCWGRIAPRVQGSRFCLGAGVAGRNEVVIQVDAQAQEQLQRFLDQGIRMPAMPTTNAELLGMLRRPSESINMHKMAELVQEDPPLAARLLRVANSPFYGARRGVTRVGQAVMTIGLDETLSILNYYLLRRAFEKIPDLPHFSLDEFWRHALAVGTVARLLGQPKYLVSTLPGELYTAGLLHDIGKLVLGMHMADRYAACLERAWEAGLPLHEAERQVFGLDHAILGGQLLDNWNLPPIILDGVAFHHDPESADPQYRECSALVQFAHAILGEANLLSSCDPASVEFSQTWICRFRPDSPLANQSLHEVLVEEARRELEQHVRMIEEAEVHSGEEADAAGRASSDAAAPSPQGKPAGSGFWAWLAGFFK